MASSGIDGSDWFPSSSDWTAWVRGVFEQLELLLGRFGFSEQALCQWPCLPQYMQCSSAFCLSFSVVVSFLNFLSHGALFLGGKLASAISGLSGSLGLAPRMLVHRCPVEGHSLEAFTCHCHQIWSNSRASWTRHTRVVGAG